LVLALDNEGFLVENLEEGLAREAIVFVDLAS
jgi:hypothetical protein